MIRAETHPDDHAVEVYFDATPWFAQASDDEIVKLAKCKALYTPPGWGDVEVWGQDYPSDRVAQWMADHGGDTAQMFGYIDITGCGYECYVHAEDARRWCRDHRPHLGLWCKRANKIVPPLTGDVHCECRTCDPELYGIDEEE